MDLQGVMDGLQTVDALEFSRVPRQYWNSALHRGLVPWAPRTNNGVARVFDVDALVAAFCLGQLHDLQVAPRIAGKIAEEIYRQVERDHSIIRLSAWRVAGRRGKPRVLVSENAPVDDAVELIRFEVGDIRVLALKGIRAKLREQHRQDAP